MSHLIRKLVRKKIFLTLGLWKAKAWLAIILLDASGKDQ